MEYNVYSEFDIQQHKQTYVNYLEVIILPTGKIVYAVPSHQEKLIEIACQKHNCSREILLTKCPPSMYGDFMTWFEKETGCVAVWTNFISGHPNRFQKAALEKLRKAKLLQDT